MGNTKHSGGLKMSYSENMNVFSIWHENDAIRLETNQSEFTSLEKIMMLGARHFIDQGKTKDLQRIIKDLQTKLPGVS